MVSFYHVFLAGPLEQGFVMYAIHQQDITYSLHLTNVLVVLQGKCTTKLTVLV